MALINECCCMATQLVLSVCLYEEEGGRERMEE